MAFDISSTASFISCSSSGYQYTVSDFSKFFCNGFANAFTVTCYDNDSIVIAVAVADIAVNLHLCKISVIELFTI
jgi:hypothetical protein